MLGNSYTRKYSDVIRCLHLTVATTNTDNQGMWISDSSTVSVCGFSEKFCSKQSTNAPYIAFLEIQWMLKSCRNNLCYGNKQNSIRFWAKLFRQLIAKGMLSVTFRSHMDRALVSHGDCLAPVPTR